MDDLAFRQQAWAFGREVRDKLVARYESEYDVVTAPPPAQIVDELLTDFLEVELRYDPLPLDRFAQTELKGTRPVVTVNTLTAEIPPVVNAKGWQNVAKFHEVIHVVRDLELPAALDNGRPDRIVCLRSTAGLPPTDDERLREFWAAEAGRAAAVCHASVARSQTFQTVSDLGHGRPLRDSEVEKFLTETASEIGVNVAALVRQLELEARFLVSVDSDRNAFHVELSLSDWLGVA